MSSVNVYAEDWYPLPVTSHESNGVNKRAEYIPLESAEKPWNICVSFPHMKDSFWLAADYGVVEEAKRLGVKLQVMVAGGYTELNTQISQIENCVSGGADAVVIGSISQDGLKNLVAELKKKDIPVVDAYNGIASEDISARVLTIPSEEGRRAGAYLAEKHPAGSTPVKVGWLPGPAGAGFVELFNQGFTQAIEGSAVEIVETKYGDTGKEIQSRLIEDMLQTHPDIDYIVGTAVTAEAAIPLLRSRGQQKDIKVVSVYMTPGVYQGLKRGAVDASGVAPVVLTGRIAIDQAVRLVEGKPLLKDVGPMGRVYTANEVDALDQGSVLAPAAFKPVFRVN